MKIVVNGKEMEIAENQTIMHLLKALKIEDKTMAAAVNMEVVKKENWSKHLLNEGDRVEFLHFVGGG